MVKPVAIIYYGGFSRFGGVYSHVRTVEHELSQLGWLVYVITLDCLPFWCRYIPHLIERLINLFYKPLGFYYKGRFTRFLYKIYYDRKSDLKLFEDVYISWNSKCKSITILHAVWSDNLHAFSIKNEGLSKLKNLEHKIIEKVSHPIATVSYPYKNYIKTIHFKSLLNKDIDVIELGIDQSFIEANTAFCNAGKAIVYVGALESRKNVKFLLQVFQQIKFIDSEYKLTIVGDGPDKNSLMDYAKNNNLNVSFKGALSRADVLLELKRHQIYVHTSLKESFSYSLLEAKLIGLITCAYEGLEVPSEFIDIKLSKFEINEWKTKILNINCDCKYKFNSQKYTAKRMIEATLTLAK
jgi:glycosyltransferase involved in cell wall biosynthesis